MTDLYAMYETNKKEEVGGKWITEGPAKVKMARMGGKNTQYGKIFEKLSKKYNINVESLKDDVNREKAEDLALEVFVKAVIKDWKTLNEDDEWVDGILVRDSKGKKTIEPYSHRHAIKLLKAIPDYYSKLTDHAGKMQTFLLKQEEEDVKN